MKYMDKDELTSLLDLTDNILTLAILKLAQEHAPKSI